MAYRINFNRVELRAAAEFVWKNNPYARNWADSQIGVEKHISDFIIDHATRNLKALEKSLRLGKPIEDWLDWTGTGGYYITMFENTDTDDDRNRVGPLSVHVDILVDPAVGSDRQAEDYQSWDIDNG